MMSDPTASMKVEPSEEGWPIFEVWAKYEEIAMHFNDLLMRLRTQALGAVAALATIIGIFARAGAETHTNWEMVTFAFIILTLFWIAVWIIDFCYYNKLLQGAVVSLVKLEGLSKEGVRVKHIDISSTIEDTVAGYLPKNPKSCHTGVGRWVFYLLVTAALTAGSGFSLYKTLKHTEIPTESAARLNQAPRTLLHFFYPFGK
jgi:hypothetical protein